LVKKLQRMKIINSFWGLDKLTVDMVFFCKKSFCAFCKRYIFAHAKINLF